MTRHSVFHPMQMSLKLHSYNLVDGYVWLELADESGYKFTEPEKNNLSMLSFRLNFDDRIKASKKKDEIKKEISQTKAKLKNK